MNCPVNCPAEPECIDAIECMNKIFSKLENASDEERLKILSKIPNKDIQKIKQLNQCPYLAR